MHLPGDCIQVETNSLLPLDLGSCPAPSSRTSWPASRILVLFHQSPTLATDSTLDFEDSDTKMATPYDIETYLLDKANIQDTMVRMVSDPPVSFLPSFVPQPRLLEPSMLKSLHRCTASTQERPRHSSIRCTRRRCTLTTIHS